MTPSVTPAPPTRQAVDNLLGVPGRSSSRHSGGEFGQHMFPRTVGWVECVTWSLNRSPRGRLPEVRFGPGSVRKWDSGFLQSSGLQLKFCDHSIDGGVSIAACRGSRSAMDPADASLVVISETTALVCSTWVVFEDPEG